MGVTLRNTLAEVVKHTAPAFLGTVTRTAVPELGDKIQNVKARALQLNDEHKLQDSHFNKTYMHFMPFGPFIATVVGEVLIIVKQGKDSTAGQKFLAYSTLGGTLLTGGIAGFAYGQYFFRKDELILQANINQIGESHETFKLLKSSAEILEKCLSSKSLQSLKDSYENFKMDMLNGFKHGAVPIDLCTAWLSLDFTVPNVKEKPVIPKELLDNVKSQIIRYKNLHETHLQPFRKATKDTSIARSSLIEESDVGELIEELNKLINESFTINKELKDKQLDETAPTLSELYTKFAPVGGWCSSTAGIVAEIIDRSSKQSGVEITFEALTLAAALGTGFLTTFVYFKHKDHVFLKKLHDEITKHTDSMLEIIKFLEASHEAAKLCMNKDTSFEAMKEKCKNLKNEILHGSKKDAVHSSLYAHWMEARSLIKQKKLEPVSNIYNNEELENENKLGDLDQNAIKKEMRKIMKEKILPHIQHHISLYDAILPPVKAEEVTGWRSWRIVKCILGDLTQKKNDFA